MKGSRRGSSRVYIIVLAAIILLLFPAACEDKREKPVPLLAEPVTAHYARAGTP